MNNYDIVQQMLEDCFAVDIGGGDITRRNRRDLARFARISKTFSAAALQVLWSALDSLIPLWYILAPFDFPQSGRGYDRFDGDKVSAWLQLTVGLPSRETRD